MARAGPCPAGVQLEAILCSGERTVPDQFDEAERFVWLEPESALQKSAVLGRNRPMRF